MAPSAWEWWRARCRDHARAPDHFDVCYHARQLAQGEGAKRLVGGVGHRNIGWSQHDILIDALLNDLALEQNGNLVTRRYRLATRNPTDWVAVGPSRGKRLDTSSAPFHPVATEHDLPVGLQEYCIIGWWATAAERIGGTSGIDKTGRTGR